MMTTWLRSFRNGDPALRLVCFPHSGASASTYAAWPKLFCLPRAGSEVVEICAVQYPGHGDRLGEPFVDSLHDMADGVVGELRRLRPLPTVLFGHSMGALVAYETARRLDDRDAPAQLLAVSGCPAPDAAGRVADATGQVDDLWEAARAFGAVPAELAANAEFAELIRPMLDSDVRLQAGYRSDSATLSCPIVGYVADDDDLATRDDMSGWATATASSQCLHQIGSGHLHVTRDPSSLVENLRNHISACRDGKPCPRSSPNLSPIGA